MFNGEMPFWLAPLLTIVVLAFFAYRDKSRQKQGRVQYDERTKINSYRASHLTLMIYFAGLAVAVIYSTVNQILEIKISVLSLAALPLAAVWLIIFAVLQRK
ncbi:hypothetical protein [Paenibacillus sp. SYP-B4298]|uniref:hypothetical protein n=1 Tax=Paenibacillus sp. SYP-B4298 TaxID=2996034 RepID=UPI0022DD10F9|nr:hypothetical protein [Paenibacillus sp. SYP-B4298]